MTFHRILSLLLPSFVAATASAQTYNAAADFSTTVNPNGVWSYGSQSAPGGALSVFTLQNTGPALTAVGTGGDLRGWNGPQQDVSGVAFTYPFVLKNVGTTPYVVTNNDGGGGGIVTPVGALSLHASTTVSATVRFTAPSVGVYDIAGSFSRQQTSTTPYAQRTRVSYGGASPYDTTLTGNGAVGSFSFLGVALSAGQTVDFSTSSLPDFNGGTIGLNATVTAKAVPEPTSMIALGVGALALVRRRRR